MMHASSLVSVRAPLAVLTFLLCLANNTQGQEPEKSLYIESDGVLVAPVAGSTDYLAYSVPNGEWTKHTFPKKLKVLPIVASGVCVFAMSGSNIEELVAVDKNGKWCPFKLPAPTKAKCEPIVDNKMAVFWIDGKAYAFSAETGAWDSIDAPTVPIVGGNGIIKIVTANSIAVFNVRTGKWAVAITRVKPA